MPNHHTYSFPLHLNSHHQLVLPIDINIERGDLVIWRLRSGTAITGIKIIGDGAPFVTPLSTDYAPVVWGIIKQDVADNYEWNYRIAITAGRDSSISVDPKIKIKPQTSISFFEILIPVVAVIMVTILTVRFFRWRNIKANQPVRPD